MTTPAPIILGCGNGTKFGIYCQKIEIKNKIKNTQNCILWSTI